MQPEPRLGGDLCVGAQVAQLLASWSACRGASTRLAVCRACHRRQSRVL